MKEPLAWQDGGTRSCNTRAGGIDVDRSCNKTASRTARSKTEDGLPSWSALPFIMVQDCLQDSKEQHRGYCTANLLLALLWVETSSRTANTALLVIKILLSLGTYPETSWTKDIVHINIQSFVQIIFLLVPWDRQCLRVESLAKTKPLKQSYIAGVWQLSHYRTIVSKFFRQHHSMRWVYFTKY